MLIALLLAGASVSAQVVDQKIAEKTACLSEGFTFARFYGDDFITSVINLSIEDDEVSVIETQVLDSTTVVLYETKLYKITIELPEPNIRRTKNITVVPK